MGDANEDKDGTIANVSHVSIILSLDLFPHPIPVVGEKPDALPKRRAKAAEPAANNKTKSSKQVKGRTRYAEECGTESVSSSIRGIDSFCVTEENARARGVSYLTSPRRVNLLDNG